MGNKLDISGNLARRALDRRRLGLAAGSAARVAAPALAASPVRGTGAGMVPATTAEAPRRPGGPGY